MDWFSFALLGAASLAFTGVIDKFILEKYVSNSYSYLVCLILFQQIFAAGIFYFMGSGFVYPQSFYAALVGIVQIMYWAAYLKALKVEETSRIAALVFVYPVFVFPAAVLILGEALALKGYIGGLFLVFSAILVSYRPPVPSMQNRKNSLNLSPALRYMFLFWIFYATYSIAAKYLLAYMDEWHLMLWLSLGNLLAVLAFLTQKGIREELVKYFHAGYIFFHPLQQKRSSAFRAGVRLSSPTRWDHWHWSQALLLFSLF